MIRQRENIWIEIGYLSKEDVCTFSNNGLKQYGYLLLRHLYLTERNEIKWNLLRTLYPSLQGISITNAEPIADKQSQYNYLPSIHVDDAFMSSMLSFLSSYSDPQIQRIFINQPLDSLQELEAIKTKYEASFKSKGYVLFVDANESLPQVNGHYIQFSCYHADFFKSLRHGRK